jgi:hypothetical protein
MTIDAIKSYLSIKKEKEKKATKYIRFRKIKTSMLNKN